MEKYGCLIQCFRKWKTVEKYSTESKEWLIELGMSQEKKDIKEELNVRSFPQNPENPIFRRKFSRTRSTMRRTYLKCHTYSFVYKLALK